MDIVLFIYSFTSSLVQLISCIAGQSFFAPHKTAFQFLNLAFARIIPNGLNRVTLSLLPRLSSSCKVKCHHNVRHTNECTYLKALDTFSSPSSPLIPKTGSQPYSGSLFSSRRDSVASAATVAGGPPATDPAGSIHNLQLDIMDDIVQARKARMKLWNTSSEKVCEVHTVDEAGAASQSPKRYSNRRYSDFVGSTLAPIPSNRRASENFVSPAAAAAVAASVTAAPATPSGSSMAVNFLKKSGIVVTKNDLLSLMSSLTSSANEINRIDDADEPVPPPLSGFTCKTAAKPAAAAAAAGSSMSDAAATSNTLLMPEPGMQRSNRSNSFDVSILHNCKQIIAGSAGAAGGTAGEQSTSALSGWFEKRHQPMSRKKSLRPQACAAATVSFSKDVLDRFKDKEEKSGSGGAGGAGGGGGSGASSASSGGGATPRDKKSRGKLRWDNKSSFVDPHIIGNAIEGFLRKSRSGGSGGGSSKESRAKKAGAGSGGSGGAARFWFGKAEEDDSKDTCDSSLCATLKDLFVK